MKLVSLLLSLLVVITTVAQKPLDRGIHKRKTGGLAFLWGEQKTQDVDRIKMAAANEVLPLEPLSAEVVGMPFARVDELASSERKWSAAPTTSNSEVRRVHRVLRPLKRRGFALVDGPAFVDRSLRRVHIRKVHPAREKAPLDWMSVLGFVSIVLALTFLDSAAGLWLLGLVLTAMGKRRTKKGRFRGRRLAVLGFLLGLIYPMVYFLGVVLGAVTIGTA